MLYIVSEMMQKSSFLIREVKNSNAKSKLHLSTYCIETLKKPSAILKTKRMGLSEEKKRWKSK